jgi:hypothetical protein
LFDRRSPINFFSASDRVSKPLRRSLPERLSSFSRLIASRIAKSPDTQPRIGATDERVVKMQAFRRLKLRHRVRNERATRIAMDNDRGFGLWSSAAW